MKRKYKLLVYSLLWIIGIGLFICVVGNKVSRSLDQSVEKL